MESIRTKFKELTQTIESEISLLHDEKNKLEKDVSNLINERESPKNYNVDRVQLDIGGFQFSTSLNTLRSIPNSYFGKLFSQGSFPSHLFGSDERLFIDRDGRLFRYILNCLRDPENFELRLRGKQDLDDLRKETQFYGIEDLVFKNKIFIPDTLNWLDEKKIKLVAFSSEHSDRFPATNVLDYSRTYWLSLPGQIIDQWLTFDFGTEAYITKISVKVDNFECTVKDFSIQYTEDDYKSNDSWVTIKEFQAQVGNQNTGEQFFDGFEFRGRYMRMFCKNNWGPGGGNFILITTLKFYGALDE
jgi:hypothetical protein